jgi:nucleoside-diphosphate-sugar epimerase
LRAIAIKGLAFRRSQIEMPEYAPSAADEFLQLDLRSHDNCKAAVKGVSEVYHLAADMGGIGYISGSHATITLNNTLINAHMIAAVSQSSVERFYAPPNHGRVRGHATAPATTLSASRRSGCRQNDHGRPADEGADRARRWRCARKARNVPRIRRELGALVAGVTTYAPLLLPFRSRPYSAWRLSIAGPPLTREKMLEAASSH